MDETCQGKGRFGAIGVVSMPLYWDQSIEEELHEILNSSGIDSEFKWEKIRSAKYCMAAEKMIKYIVDRCVRGHMRIDVIGWDDMDAPRDYVKDTKMNVMSHMSYVVVKRVVTARWDRPAVWRMYPDAGSSVKWSRTLNMISSDMKYKIKDSMRMGRDECVIDKIQELSSSGCAMIQVADLFAGMMACSMMVDAGRVNNNSISSVYRNRSLRTMLDYSSSRSLGIWMHAQGGLRTRSRNSNINFWKYRQGVKYIINQSRSAAWLHLS